MLAPVQRIQNRLPLCVRHLTVHLSQRSALTDEPASRLARSDRRRELAADQRAESIAQNILHRSGPLDHAAKREQSRSDDIWRISGHAPSMPPEAPYARRHL